jgi:hypothetical protein
MIHALWRWLQLLLPFGLLLHIYRNHKALPANIKMQNGRLLKAIMITTDYGLLFSEEKYVDNRLKRLVAKQKEISHVNDLLVKEINELDFIQKEQLLGNLRDDI